MKENPLIPESAFILFNEAEKSLDKKLLKYSEAAEDALRLDDMNLQEKALVAPSLHHGFINSLYAERRLTAKLSALKDQKEIEYIERFGAPDVPKYRIAEEAKNSDEIQKLEAAIQKQKDIVKYLEEICKIMAGFNFNIKNAVEMCKLSM